MRLQQTIKNSVSINGYGVHSGIKTTVTIHPSDVDSGIKFIRNDLKGNPVINAIVDNVSTTNRRTVLTQNNISIETVEHILAAIYAYSIDNINIEINGPEVPIMDGSSACFIKMIEDAQITTQKEKIIDVHLPNYFKVEGSDNSVIEFIPQENIEIDVSIDYNSEILPKQNYSLQNLSNFKAEISASRTFCFLHELKQLTENNLIKGGDLHNSVVFIEEDIPMSELGTLKNIIQKDYIKLDVSNNILKKGILNNTALIYDNEQARHKLLDLIGDMCLVGYNIKGKIIAHKPGHKINSQFTRKLKEEIIKNMKPQEPLMILKDIKKILPHREPFLFIDEITELTQSSITGLKYVDRSEYYFKGHFPSAPIMPGVLQIEAMAQTGGILALNSVPDPENYLTYFMKIDKVKFKQKVEPNCILIFKLNLLSPIRRGICHMEAKAYVNNTIVTEAELMAKIVKEK